MEFLVALAIAWMIQAARDQAGSAATSHPRAAAAARTAGAAVSRAGRVVAAPVTRTSRRPSSSSPSLVATGGGWVSTRTPAAVRNWGARRRDNWRAGWSEGRDLAQGRLPGDPVPPRPGPGPAEPATTPTSDRPRVTAGVPSITAPSTKGDPVMTAPAPTVPPPASPSGPSGGPGRSSANGGVAAAEFNLDDLYAMLATHRKQLEYASAHMNAGQMGSVTVSGLIDLIEANGSFERKVHSIHDRMHQAAKEQTVVGKTEQYVTR